jgi:hypothetical protein
MFTLLFRIAQKLILIYHSDPLCFYPCDLAPLQSPPPTPPPRFHPSDSAPSASTPPTRPLWGWGGGRGEQSSVVLSLKTTNVPVVLMYPECCCVVLLCVVVCCCVVWCGVVCCCVLLCVVVWCGVMWCVVVCCCVLLCVRGVGRSPCSYIVWLS